jgi:hypothetical protein
MGKVIECHFFARNKRPQAEQPRQQTQIVVASCLQYAGKLHSAIICQFGWRQQAQGVSEL